MPQFVLPEGYSFAPPDQAHVLGDSVPDKGYGGADISQEWDLHGVHYVGCNAWGPGDPSFRWRMFKEIRDGVYAEVPLTFLSTGRGEMQAHLYDGKAWAIAWKDNVFNYDVVPGFVPFPSMAQLVARLSALEDAGAPLPHPTHQPIPIAKDSPIGLLYSGVPPYEGKHFDTPEETALRYQKLLMAVHQVVDILWRQGLVVKL